MKKIAVLVSGGVDSSVALRLLKDQGYDVTAFYLKIWLEDELSYLGTCPWKEDLKYVEQVCAQANVPLKTVSLQREYWDQVVSYTISEIKAGRTPNPDIMCNKRVKFGAFFSKIDSSYDYIATGHYAQIKRDNGEVILSCAPDPVKDQTYFLAHLSNEQLKKTIFPIGHLQKAEVRELAQKYNLPNKRRKDSQGICFLGKLKFSDFIRHHMGDLEGNIVEFETNKRLGTHKGFWYYTIGQRQGLGLAGGPWYVVSKDISKNIVYTSKSYYELDKSRSSLVISSCNWINKINFKSNLKNNLDKLYRIKLRHGSYFNTGTIKLLDNLQDNLDYKLEDKYEITLKSRDQGIAAGQYAVIYDDQVCLGSGIII